MFISTAFPPHRGDRVFRTPGTSQDLGIALFLAAGFHLIIIVLYYLTAPLRPEPATRPPTIIDRRVYFPPSVAPGGVRVKVEPTASLTAEAAIPVPVPVDEVRPGLSIPAQTQMTWADGGGEGTGPEGAVSGTGVEGSTGPGEAFGVPGAGDPEPFTFVQEPPVPVRSVTPEYPRAARAAGIEGDVFVSMLVDREGRVKKVKLIRSTNEVFNENVFTAAREWIFKPGENGNGPVPAWVSVPFRFRLKR